MEKDVKSSNANSAFDLLNLFNQDRGSKISDRKAEVRKLYDDCETSERQVEVFWGEQMNVLLPEEISSSLYCHGSIEPNLSTFLFQFLKPGDTFIDVGAHIGYFSRLAANRVGTQGRIIALEPMPTTFQWLARNTDAFNQIHQINVAAWNIDHRQILFNDYGILWSAYSTAYEARLPKDFLRTLSCKSVHVPTVTLDTLSKVLHLFPTVIKIDAESAELQVLQGMENYLLKSVLPVVTLEVGDLEVANACSSRSVIQWLLERNYEVFEYRAGALVTHQLRDQYGYDNLIFFPKSRSSEFSKRLQVV